MMDEHDGLPAHIKEIMVDWSNLLNRKYKPCSAPQTINALSNAVVSASAAAVPIATGSNNNASRRKRNNSANTIQSQASPNVQNTNQNTSNPSSSGASSWSCARTTNPNDKCFMTLDVETKTVKCTNCGQALIPRELNEEEQKEKSLWTSACATIYNWIFVGLSPKDALTYRSRPITEAFEILADLKKRINLQRSGQAVPRLTEFWNLVMKKDEGIMDFVTRINEVRSKIVNNPNLIAQGNANLSDRNCLELLLAKVKQNEKFHQAAMIWDTIGLNLGMERTYQDLINHLLSYEQELITNKIKQKEDLHKNTINNVNIRNSGNRHNSNNTNSNNTNLNLETTPSNIPCRFFNFGKGVCKYGSMCKFTHNPKFNGQRPSGNSEKFKQKSSFPPSNSSGSKRKQSSEICIAFQKGTCDKGPLCPRLHIKSTFNKKPKINSVTFHPETQYYGDNDDNES
jgi:hypothetical protein